MSALVWIASGVTPTPALAETGRHVLVVYSNARLLPANIEADRGFRETLQAAVPGVEISAEFLDYPRFAGPDHVDNLKTYLKRKYAGRAPDVVVAAGGDSLRILRESKNDLFPAAPLVHFGVLSSQMDVLSEGRAVGVPIELDAAGTISDALRLHTKADKVIVITGSSPIDRGFEQQFRRDLASLAGTRDVVFLAGLSTSAILQRLTEADERTIVFTPGYFRDEDGREFFPRETVVSMAQAAASPIYVPFDTFIGAGVVGGRMTSFHDVGVLGAQIVQTLFEGKDPVGLDLPKSMPTKLHVDWRQVERWGVDPALLPAGAVVHFRQPGYWEAHSSEVVTVFSIVALQAALISLLLIERQRRQRTELALQKNRFQLAHASRLAIAGELTGSIAHEINQPLSAILSNAAAAELLLDSGADQKAAIKDILKDIQRDDIRASQVIRRLRALLQKQEYDHELLDLNSVLIEVAEILRAETNRRHAVVTVNPAGAPAEIIGDRVQMQQILINLVLNALDSVSELRPARRRIMVGIDVSESKVLIDVQDRGAGITAENLPRVFDSFYTTKPAGMGLGLSIVRTIVEAHGGSIEARNLSPHGAAFQINLPRFQRGSLMVEAAK